jgi:hypothetical protein
MERLTRQIAIIVRCASFPCSTFQMFGFRFRGFLFVLTIVGHIKAENEKMFYGGW